MTFTLILNIECMHACFTYQLGNRNYVLILFGILLTCFMYLLSFVILNMATLSCAPKHEWTNEEEGTLIDCLVELVSTSGWKSDNGTCRLDYLAQLVHMMRKKLSRCHV